MLTVQKQKCPNSSALSFSNKNRSWTGTQKINTIGPSTRAGRGRISSCLWETASRVVFVLCSFVFSHRTRCAGNIIFYFNTDVLQSSTDDRIRKIFDRRLRPEPKTFEDGFQKLGGEFLCWLRRGRRGGLIALHVVERAMLIPFSLHVYFLRDTWPQWQNSSLLDLLLSKLSSYMMAHTYYQVYLSPTSIPTWQCNIQTKRWLIINWHLVYCH